MVPPQKLVLASGATIRDNTVKSHHIILAIILANNIHQRDYYE